MALNPIAFTENVVRSFLRYQLTAYPFADQDLYGQMRRLLSLDQTRLTPLLRGPYVSLSRSFRAGASIAELVKEKVLHPAMPSLVSFPSVYGHQERAIRSIHGRRTTLVSTGTGSGKTEAFLFPIVSRCLELRDAAAPSGIVAVLVYPMNALAEDQLLRLRDLLAGTGIRFGMYVGKTPEREVDVAGERLRAGASRADYRAAVERAQAENRAVAVHPPEECCSRESMRKPGGQPRVLLTNVKQLELLLTRHTDETLFDGATLEFLVFDEAHTFSGAMGAETACLVRRLRGFCGRRAADTTCIATSATIADPARGVEPAREFAARFFGVSASDVQVVQEEYEAHLWPPERGPGSIPGEPAARLASVLQALDGDEEHAEKLGRMLEELGIRGVAPESWQADLFSILARNETVYQIAQALDQPRPVGELLDDLRSRLGRPITIEEVLLWLALAAASRTEGRPLLRPVIHGFLSGVAGAAVTFPVGEARPRLWLSAEEAASSEPKAARLAITTCTTCGQHYFVHHLADFTFTEKQPGGGEAIGEGRVWRALDPSLGGKRAILLDAVVGADTDDDDDDDDGIQGVDVHFCRMCGAAHPAAVERCDGCGIDGPLVALKVLRQSQDTPGFLRRCVSCKAPGRKFAGRFREPARPVRAVNVADVHVLAQDMIRFAERRRLLVFADNRQDAAFQAGWMRDHARRFRLRALMAERIGTDGIRPGDLAAALDAALDADDELSRSLAPEVWSVAQKSGEPVQHGNERRLFLRIQVLREIATGVKQRVGLEPWGRMQVEYDGLDRGAGFIQAASARLALPPDRLTDGIASILDRMRRTNHLLDRQTEIFTRFWDEGSREVLRGYLPVISGVPKGLKLARAEADNRQRVTQWLSLRGDTAVRQAARKWGVPGDELEQFVRDLWSFVQSDLRLLAPVTLKGSRGLALPACGGVYQVDTDKLLLFPHRGYWRCRRCRRTQPRPAPLDRCLAWRCDGSLEFIEEDPDNYDLSLLDGNVPMLRPREHSAQVPASEREILENAFKGERETVNTLVCTPTLELGVDIGALDTVLMRNVPPLPANYWQRAGRAGRRHRMAVNLTYARNVSHDRAYFAQPERLLGGRIEPPRFNLRNELMVRKHVHAAMLTRLHRFTRPTEGLAEPDREEITNVLRAMFPSLITTYLFDDRGHVRSDVYDVSPLRTIVSKHEERLTDHVAALFTDGWPEGDREAVDQERLRAYVDEMPDRLERVIRTLRKRLDWALSEITRLGRVREERGALEPDEDALFGRCDRLVKRLKGQLRRQRQESEGIDDVSTFGVLAAEGFFPGYGLDVGAVTGTAIVPRQILHLSDFDLRRPTSLAVREFVPGNLIYANGHEFGPRFYHLGLEAAQHTVFDVDTASESISEVGGGLATLGSTQIRAVPISDVDLPHLSHISDEEENRFQLPVTVYGYEQGRHAGGRAYQWADRTLLLRRNVHLRLVNVGAASLVGGGARLGYPVCLVCGQSRSVLASQRERDDFADRHRERCGQPVGPTGFFADVVADAFSLSCDSREDAYSILEALRIGATQVLEMDREDLEVLVVGHAGDSRVDALLYDPMPGGSGLLDQLCGRFGEVVEAATDILAICASACSRSCIDCMQTFRNAFFHNHLSRHTALRLFGELGGNISFSHDLPSRLPEPTPSGSAAPTNVAEDRLRELLRRAGFPEPKWQYPIELGKPLGTTRPDCFFSGESPDEPGICVYLDGLSEHIHGNPATAHRDRQMRENLRARGYDVLEIPASDLNDREAMRRHFFRLGKELLGKERAREIRDAADWFERQNADPDTVGQDLLPFSVASADLKDRFATCVPLLSLQAAAGAFGDDQVVEFDSWVTPRTSRRLRQGMFVAQVRGKSMLPRIPDGAYCLFASPVEGSRQGRIVLVEHHDIQDPDNGGRYTVKQYRSQKERSGAGGWEHVQIQLEPVNPDFPPIVLTPESEGEVRCIAEMVEVLGQQGL